MGGGGPVSVSRRGVESSARAHDDVRDVGTPSVEWDDLDLAAAHDDRLFWVRGGDWFGLNA